MKNILQRSVDALTCKKEDYESALQDADNNILRLLYADSASVIGDCIDLVSETAREYGIPMT